MPSLTFDRADSEDRHDQAMRTRWPATIRLGIVFVAWIFVACLGIQLFLAGLGVFGDARYFAAHRAFVHAFGWLAFLLLLLAFAGSLSWRIRGYALGLVALVSFQYMTARQPNMFGTGLPGALHPVGAACLVLLSVAMAREATRALRQHA